MARRKQEPCEYCDGDFYQDMDPDGNLYLEMYPGKHVSASCFVTNPNTEEPVELYLFIPCNFCPNCGRKLTEY